MKWYRKLYLGEGINKSKEQLVKKLETNAGLPGVYVVTLAANGRDLFDIFSADQLLWPVLHGLCPMIVGLAKGYDEAVSMATDIVLDAYRINHDFDVQRYLRGRLDGGEEMFFEYPMEKLKKRRRFGSGK